MYLHNELCTVHNVWNNAWIKHIMDGLWTFRIDWTTDDRDSLWSHCRTAAIPNTEMNDMFCLTSYTAWIHWLWFVVFQVSALGSAMIMILHEASDCRQPVYARVSSQILSKLLVEMLVLLDKPQTQNSLQHPFPTWRSNFSHQSPVMRTWVSSEFERWPPNQQGT
jgi:hypothetical protein